VFQQTGYLLQFLVEKCEAQLEGLSYENFILFIHKLEGIFQKLLLGS